MKIKVKTGLSLCLSFVLGIAFAIGFIQWKHKYIAKDDGFPTTELEIFRYYQESMNAPSHPVAELADKIINNGSKESYYELGIYYLDIGAYKFLPWALLMANKYKYDQAYFDVFYYLYELSNKIEPKSENLNNYSLDNLDKKTQKMAIEYLKIAASKGHEQAKEILSLYKKEGKYVNK